MGEITTNETDAQATYKKHDINDNKQASKDCERNENKRTSNKNGET